MLLAFAKVILTPFLGCKGLQGVITLSRVSVFRILGFAGSPPTTRAGILPEFMLQGCNGP